MKEGFKSVKEILKEVAEEDNIPYEEVKNIWDHQKKMVVDLMEKEDVYAIYLPYIGTLYLNVKQYEKELKGKSKKFYESFINKVKKLKAHENYTMYSNAHKKVTGVSRLARYIYSRYEALDFKRKSLRVHKKCWDLISKYSNGVLNKRDEPLKRF